MTHGSLYSGIGGFDLTAQWLGWENIFDCEINPFCQIVLKYHFPNSIQHHDTTGNRFQRRGDSGELRGEGERGNERFTNMGGLSRENWQNFPTQSPVCSGNDEFSSRLDAITFSKWRQESIKAYGNAVVPPLVLEIFKAIESYVGRMD